MSDPGPDPIGWHHNPSYSIDFDPLPARVQALLNRETVADTTAARVMYELGHAPVYYLPRGDVNMALLEPTDRDTYCPYKGHASYWTVRVGTRTAENAIWSYEIPGRIDAGNQLKALFPQLAEEWHPTRNAGIKPYEFAPYSNELVWWRDASGDEWQARIKDRVLEVTALRADGDATPYG
jgi:uncharacterized protein (DUF427 family)